MQQPQSLKDTEHFLRARHCSERSSLIDSMNPHNTTGGRYTVIPILQMGKPKQCLSNLADGKSYGSLVLFRDTQVVKIPSERWLRWGPRGL